MEKYSIKRLNRQLEFKVQGTGIPIFIVGFGSYTFKLLSNELKSKFQFILHDFYGLLQTDIEYDLSIDNILDDISAIQNFLGIEKLNIIGHSSSGTIALDYALKNMDLVNKLFMVCSPIIYDSEYFKFQQENLEKNLTGERKNVFDRNLADFEKKKDQNKIKDFFKEYHAVQTPLYFYDYNYSIPDYWDDIPVNPDFINSFIDKTYNVYERKEDFLSIRNKLVSFVGRYDFATPVQTWEPYLNELNVYIFENSAHNPMIEEQQKFDEIMIYELESVES